jgi:4-hydroxybenzoate polyprenyltransferase
MPWPKSDDREQVSEEVRGLDGATGSDSAVPLVVDVDGTLIKTDLLYEASLRMIAIQPFQAWRMLVWLAKGKIALKTALADRGDPGTATMPLREEVIAAIQAAQGANRPVYLASASDRRYVEKLAARVGGIEGVFATDATVNLSGAAKAQRLVAEFGAGRFDYMGDADVDFPVWRQARKVLALTHDGALEERLLEAFPDAEIVARPRPRAKDYLKALRPHQWVKNVLVFLPMIAGHQFTAQTIVSSIMAFACFCMAASSSYLINDLLDLPGDRDHPLKRLRTFAAGTIPLRHGIFVAALLIIIAFSTAATLPRHFAAMLGLYYATTLVYSFVLKRKVMIDVVVLGGLYTLRVLGGVTASGAAQSPWLLMFSLFLFLSLAIVKRCSELTARIADGKGAALGRGYRVEDLRVLLPFGAAAGYGAVFVVALYLSSPEVRVLYAHPTRLWLVCPLLMYWISRVFVISNRNELHDDPVVFAITDRVSWATAVCVAVVLLMSIH